jgi:hypothetical protein
VHRAAGQPGGQRGGAVAGVENEERRAAPAVPGRCQAAQHVPDLGDRLARAGGLGGALHVDEGRPRGPQVPGRRHELVFPARDRLAGAVAPARVMMDVAASG